MAKQSRYIICVTFKDGHVRHYAQRATSTLNAFARLIPKLKRWHHQVIIRLSVRRIDDIKPR